MQPVRPGRKIYSAPCTKCGDELQMPQTEAASFILNARSFSTVYQPPLFHLNLLGRLSWRPLSFLAALAVSAISHCGPILFNVRQRTFMCQHRAEVAVLNPSAA